MTNTKARTVHDALIADPPRLRGGWLMAARAAWLVVALFDLAIFTVSVPAYAAQVATVCTDPSRATCNFTQLTAAELQILERFGVADTAYVAYTLVIHVGASLAFFVVGAMIFWRKSGDWYGLFVSLFLITFGAGGVSAVFADALVWAYPAMTAITDSFIVLFPALGLFLVTFPDGRFVPRWSWMIVALWIVQAIFFEAISAWPAPLFAAELLVVWGSTLAVQIYRYRRVADTTQRQQTKWVLFGFALGVSTIIVTGLLSAASPGFAALDNILEGTWVALLFTPIPLSIGVAVLKFRLWDIDPIINRTLVYGALTAIVIAVYVFIVGYLGAVFRTGGNLAISLAATGVVAMFFQPLRDRLQRGVNHLMYGERDEPYEVISRLGQRLGSTIAPDAILPAIVTTVREALKLPYAAIELKQKDGFAIAASDGDPVEGPLHLPLAYQNEPVGRLMLGPRAPGEKFSPADRKLLDDLARQAGVAAHAVRLTADLQRSREHLVTTREEERRRLRRDLHDGLGPQLAALNVQAGVVRGLIRRDPDAADELVVEMRGEIQSAVADIRRLVHELRPPALDQLGLVPALRQLATRYGAGGRSAGGDALEVMVDAPEELPPLPAAVEVAVYRIVDEALTNVVRHAHARNCAVRLAVADDLRLEIVDDGVGIPPEYTSGVGLVSMRERASELGGSCAIEPMPEGGTRVSVRIPAAKE